MFALSWFRSEIREIKNATKTSFLVQSQNENAAKKKKKKHLKAHL